MTIKNYVMPNRKIRNSRSKAKRVCKCLSCAQSWKESYEELTMLICGEEACFLNCDSCTNRPNCGSYVPVPAAI